MTDTFKITVHMVSSLDGYIAKKYNSVSWFETSDNYEKGVEEKDSGKLVESIDCYVMGSRTYEHALELSKSYTWVYGDVPTIVKDFIRLNLVHEIRQTILPIMLGEGKPFYDQIGKEKALHLKDVTAYKNGMVELCYEIK